MNHYCTYFDQRYLQAGLALLSSLRRHDPGMLLWVLALDSSVATSMEAVNRGDVRVLCAEELEHQDAALGESRRSRSAIEHLFTMSPCLPRHLLRMHAEIPAVTYVDADVFFFSDPAEMHQEWVHGSIYVVPHDLPGFLREREERFGRFNVGILGFRNDAAGHECLDWWRERCLEWCKDSPEPGRYADQKYLDQWPALFKRVVISQHPGVNAAPWNWSARKLRVQSDGIHAREKDLIAFHFAQLRRIGPRLIDTNQSEFGVMPFALRSAIYGSYINALDEARVLLRSVQPGDAARPRSFRPGLGRWAIAVAFGTIWFRVGRWWLSTGFGLGRFSGELLALQRRLRGKPV